MLFLNADFCLEKVHDVKEFHLQRTNKNNFFCWLSWEFSAQTIGTCLHSYNRTLLANRLITFVWFRLLGILSMVFCWQLAVGLEGLELVVEGLP